MDILASCPPSTLSCLPTLFLAPCILLTVLSNSKCTYNSNMISTYQPIGQQGMPWQQQMVDKMRPGYMPELMMITKYPCQQHGNMAPVVQGMCHRMHHPNMTGHPGHGDTANRYTANSGMSPNISPDSMHPAPSLNTYKSGQSRTENYSLDKYLHIIP